MAVREAAGTKERVLDAAQELFGRRGLEGTSLRAVTATAGANLAAVNYHFGSKEELFRAVIQRAMGPVTDEHRRRMEELGEDPSMEELLDAFVTPFMLLVSVQDDRSLARLVGRILTDPDPELRRRTLEQTTETDTMYLEALGRVLPRLSEGELHFRFYNILATVVFQLIGIAATEPAAESPLFAAPKGDNEFLRARTLTFLAAGLKAPPSDPEQAD